MLALTASGLLLHLRLCLALNGSLILGIAAQAQETIGGISNPQTDGLAPPQVEIIGGELAAQLEQAQALTAVQNWQEAVDLLRELISVSTNRVVPLDGHRYVSLRTFCHIQLARMPAEGLAVYRRRVDPLAQEWFLQGVSARDQRLLRRVVDEMFCSSWGDDALLALGELALECGDYAAARRWWEQISPLLRDPTGKPMWLALSEIDLESHWPDIERLWHERPIPPEWLAYPDTQLDLANVRARLILVSLRAGHMKRAQLELDVFRRLHRDATGYLGGQRTQYVAALENLLSLLRKSPFPPSSLEWSTFAGSMSRSQVAAPLGAPLMPAWMQPVVISATQEIRNKKSPISRDQSSELHVRESQRPLSCFPIVVGNTVIFADSSGIHARDLASGKPAITHEGVLQRNELPAGQEKFFWLGEEVGNLVRQDLAFPGLAMELGQATENRFAHSVPRYTLTATDHVLFSRIGQHATSRFDSSTDLSGERLIGLDLKREALLIFRVRPPDGSWSFDGVPVCDGRRVFVAMRRGDILPNTYVACFDVGTGELLWRTPIGAADTVTSGRGDEVTHNLLTLVEDRIYFNNNLGLVAALDVDHGHIVWLHRYDRVDGGIMVNGHSRPLYHDRDPSPCLYHDGLVFFAPSDTPCIFALDADTGQLIWSNDELADALHLLGVVDQNLVVSGNRLALVDWRSGMIRDIWPESQQAGIRGMGRGVICGEEIFWPTRSEIYVLNALTGQRTRTPIRLAPLGNGGANLAAGGGYLIAAGFDRLIVFGPDSTTNTLSN